MAGLSLKLLIDPKSHRLLYAEAGKDFVDFLFNIMSLPVGTVIRFLSKQVIEGCTVNIFESIEKLGDYYISETNKDILLKPMVANYAANVARMLPRLESSKYTNLYRCGNNDDVKCCIYVTNCQGKYCPSCLDGMEHNVTFANASHLYSYSGEVGFVKGAVTFMIMDDLVVRPMTSESIFTLLNEFNIKDFSDLEVKVVSVGDKEAVELLRAVIWSKSKAVLTAVFLGEEKEPSIKSEPLH